MNACHSGGAGCIIRHKCDVAQTENLAEAFVISKQEGLIFFDWCAQRAAEHIALEVRYFCLIEEISRIQRAVAQELVRVSVKLVRPRSGHDVDLGTRTLAVFGAVGVLHNLKFPHRVHTQKLRLSSRRVVDFDALVN